MPKDSEHSYFPLNFKYISSALFRVRKLPRDQIDYIAYLSNVMQKGLFKRGFTFYRKTANVFCLQLKGLLCTNTHRQRSVEESRKLHATSFFVCSPLSHPPQRKGVTRLMWLALAQTFSNNTCLRLYVSVRLCVRSVCTLRHPPDNPLVYPIPLNIRLMLHFKSVRYRSVLCGTGRCVYMPVL